MSRRPPTSPRATAELLWIVDDNFLVDPTALWESRKDLVRAERKFDWSIQASTNLVNRLTVDELKLLRRAGLRRSRRAPTPARQVLKLMNKDFQKLETIYAAAEKLTPAGIGLLQHDFRLPRRSAKERRERRLIMDICRRYPGAEFWTKSSRRIPARPS